MSRIGLVLELHRDTCRNELLRQDPEMETEVKLINVD